MDTSPRDINSPSSVPATAAETDLPTTTEYIDVSQPIQTSQTGPVEHHFVEMCQADHIVALDLEIARRKAQLDSLAQRIIDAEETLHNVEAKVTDTELDLSGLLQGRYQLFENLDTVKQATAALEAMTQTMGEKCRKMDELCRDQVAEQWQRQFLVKQRQQAKERALNIREEEIVNHEALLNKDEQTFAAFRAQWLADAKREES
ncbi:hypothetical protein EDC01DRAFT_630732 [Geopyxis carbonaria]|nr:hypothetical protein EDC01DRAFT_630732 [Geopyxis carbonaria]